MRNLLNLEAEEARNYFLHTSSYSTLNLPKYFNFDELIRISKKMFLNTETYKNVQKKGCLVNDISGDSLNHEILINKGNEKWRKITLINPIIYASLAVLTTTPLLIK